MLDNDQIEQDDLQDDVTDEPEQQEDAEGELVITLDGVADEEAAEEEPEDVGPKGQAAMKALRAAQKEAARRVKELERQLAAVTAPKVEEEDPGPKPTAADAGFDDEKLVDMVIAWKEKVDRVEAKKAEALAKQTAAQEAFKQRQIDYVTAERALPISEEEKNRSKSAVMAALNDTKQAILLRNLSGEEAARVVYALGKSPSKLDELAKMDADQFAFNLAKIAGSVKMERKPAPVETPLKGGGTGGIGLGSWKARLEAAEKKAERTGDRTEVARLRREAKAAGYSA